MEALNFLVYPFLACLLLIVIHAYFGIHILQRGIIFVDLALAQFIGVGIALSFLLGEEHGTILALAFTPRDRRPRSRRGIPRARSATDDASRYDCSSSTTRMSGGSAITRPPTQRVRCRSRSARAA